MNPDLIPALDAAGMPGPPWLFHGLLVFTFFLHMLFMNLTLGGTLLAVRQAKAGTDVELNTAIASHAWKWALWTTVLQVVDGFVLLALLPRPVLIGFMQGGAAKVVPLTLAILIGVGLLVMLAKVSNPVLSAGTVSGTLGAMLLAIAVMSVTRHQVRVLYLEPATRLFEAQVVPQWINFILWVVLLVLGLATVAYMIKRVLTEPAVGADAA